MVIRLQGQSPLCDPMGMPPEERESLSGPGGRKRHVYLAWLHSQTAGQAWPALGCSNCFIGSRDPGREPWRKFLKFWAHTACLMLVFQTPRLPHGRTDGRKQLSVDQGALSFLLFHRPHHAQDLSPPSRTFSPWPTTGPGNPFNFPHTKGT